MTTLARPSVSLGTFVCYGCRLPRLDSVPRMSEGRSNRSEGQSKCQRPQGFGGFHFGTTFRFPSIPSVNPSASTITIPPSPAPPGPYYFHHISRLQKFSLPSLPYLSDERASMLCSPSQGGNSDHGRDEADVVLTPGLSLEETDARLRNGHDKSMWNIPLSVTVTVAPHHSVWPSCHCQIILMNMLFAMQ